ncbi:NADPH-dependent FMN reductase [Domibacillus mangrovi]|uniref:FMN reductase (NADPH) n=1 Tax=Domibacillus mangrovi TaxID=1714354 RepID=A0A1Q5NZ35_9BACI|nr:NADPH-dependent FMN reductase [Domibacillus mangrovi]OKL35249.1 FMN reductase (NADPH) [Domibacillus mangrovi]
MTKAVIIYGGNSKKSRLKGILDKVDHFFQEEGLLSDTIYVHDLPAADLIQANYQSEAILEANAKVESAQVVVVLTPVYKAAYTGILKTYLDLLPQKGLEGKTVLPLVLGGSFGHLLVIDYALKPVLSALGATDILSGAYVLDTQIEYTENNQYLISAEADERLDRVLNTLKEKAKRNF